MKRIMQVVLKGYQEYANEKGLGDITEIDKYLMKYLESEEAKKIITNNLSEIMKSQNLEAQISKIMEKYMQSVMTTMSKSIEKEMQLSIAKLSKSITKAISIDTNAFASAFKMKMNEEELSELFTSLMTKEKASYDSNLKTLI